MILSENRYPLIGIMLQSKRYDAAVSCTVISSGWKM